MRRLASASRLTFSLLLAMAACQSKQALDCPYSPDLDTFVLDVEAIRHERSLDDTQCDNLQMLRYLDDSLATHRLIQQHVTYRQVSPVAEMFAANIRKNPSVHPLPPPNLHPRNWQLQQRWLVPPLPPR